MKLKKLLIIGLIAAAVMSCGDQKGGLFYSLEQEAAIYNGTLPNNITIGTMEKSSGYYFIAAGTFMYIAVDAAVGTEWTAKQPAADYLCYNMVLAGTDIYGIFFNTNTGDYKTYKTSTAAPAAGITWSDALTFSDIPATETIIDFIKSNDRIFILTSKAGNLFTVYTAALATFSETSTVEIIAADLNCGGELKASYDGTDYWITAGNKLLKSDGVNEAGTTDETAAVTAVSALLKGDGFGGVVCADTDAVAGVEVYLTSEEGVMLKYYDSDSDGDQEWTMMSNPSDTDNGLYEPLNDIIHIVVSNSNEDIDILLAGSEQGYYEMEASQSVTSKSFISAEDSNTNLTTYNQFSSIQLSEEIIMGFYFDNTPDKEKIFALGYNAGLWKNSLQGTSPNYYRFWDIE